MRPPSLLSSFRNDGHSVREYSHSSFAIQPSCCPRLCLWRSLHNLLTVPYGLCTSLRISVLAANKWFSLFLSCTRSSTIVVHPTQEWHLPAFCQPEDMILVSKMSHQWDTALRKHTWTFPFFDVTSKIFLVLLSSDSKAKSIAHLRSSLILFFRLIDEKVCDIAILWGTDSNDVNRYRGRSFCNSAFCCCNSNCSLPSARNHNKECLWLVKHLFLLSGLTMSNVGNKQQGRYVWKKLPSRQVLFVLVPRMTPVFLCHHYFTQPHCF